MRITGFRTLFAISFVMLAAVFAYPSGPGELDLSFAGTGYKYGGFGGGYDVGQAAAIQPDGKIVVAGYTSRSGGNFDVALARYDPDGTLDTTFNGDGRVVTQVVFESDQGNTVAIQPDGKIVVAGYAKNGSNNDFLILRYNSNGALDTSFAGTGKVITSVSGGNDQVWGVAIQPDGRIVAAGAASTDSAVVRYNSNGSLDTTFGAGGIVVTTYASGRGKANSVAIQADGKIVTAGNTGVGLTSDFALVRYNPDGSQDATFDGDGVVTTGIFTADDEARSLALEPGGKIVVAGGAWNGANYDFALARYNPNGSLDPGFDGDGRLTAAFGSGHDYAFSVAVQPDGKVVAAGYGGGVSSLDFALLRCDPNGSPDTTFDGDGMILTPITPGAIRDTAYSAALQPDGKILAAGYTQETGGDNFAVLRYNTDGSLDTGFDGDGKAVSDVGNSGAWGRDIAIQPDGKILTTGISLNNWALTRYNPDGTPDSSFGAGGKVVTSFEAPISYPKEMVVQPDGKILVGGSINEGSNQRIALARYNADGSLDTSFDGDGKLVVSVFGGGPNYFMGVIVQPDGRIVVTGSGQNFQTNSLHYAVFRFNADGTADTSFDGDGKVTTTTFGFGGIAVQPDGKIVIGGSVNSVFALTRYNVDGSLDTTFNREGVVVTPMLAGGSSFAASVAVLADGRIVAGGHTSNGSNRDFAVARYLSDGSSDESFDVDGKVITPVLAGNDNFFEMAVQSDGKILAVGESEKVTDTDMALVRYNTDGSLDTAYGSGGKAVIDLGWYEGAYGMALDAADNAVVAGTSYYFLTVRITANFSPLVEVGGRVTSTNGQAIGNAQVVLTDENNISQHALTNPFGYYVFSVPSNEIYTVRASAKRYRIQSGPQTILVTGPVWNVDFVGNSGSSKSAVLGGEKVTEAVRVINHIFKQDRQDIQDGKRE